MNYFDFKYLHIAIGVLYLYSVITSSYNPQKKLPKILLGITTLTLIVSGFSLLNRFGIKYQGPYPTWIWAKLAIWSVLAVVPPIVIKRFPERAKNLSFVYTLLFLAATFFGIYKA